MAYDTPITEQLPGAVTSNKAINTSVDIPVNNTRAFAETVNQGFKDLIDNDVTLQANKIDGYHGGSYRLKQNALIAIQPEYTVGTTPNQRFQIEVPTKMVGNSISRTGGFISESWTHLASPNNGSITAMGHVNSCAQTIIFTASAWSNQHTFTLKFLNDGAMYSDYVGKRITIISEFFLNANEEYICNLDLYSNEADYNSASGAKQRNTLSFKPGITNFSFITIPNFNLTPTKLKLLPLGITYVENGTGPNFTPTPNEFKFNMGDVDNLYP